MTGDTVIIPTNEFQTPITREWLDSFPDEVKDQFLDFIDTVPLLKYMVSPNRPRAKDLPKDSKGRIIVDITHPHILENMDYFRPAAKFYEQNGCYSLLKPNSNPNSEYGKWFYEEVRRCREGYVRESDGEWVTGYMYFFLNYNPIMLNRLNEDAGIYVRVEDFPDFWEGIYYRFHYIDQARHAGKHCLELARRGAHPYFQKVYTPDGIKDWGDIKIGDRLYGTHGNVTVVTDIPFDQEADVYKITLRDGREIYASDDHIWNVMRKNGKVVQRTTTELLDNYALKRPKSCRVPSGIEHQYFIPANDGVDFDKKDLPIDPYTMGVLLGDGCFRSSGYRNQVIITGVEDDIKHYASKIPYRIYKVSSDDMTWWIKVDITYLYEAGLWMKKSGDKFIPDIYKYSSREDRLNLLRGLFDTDGSGIARTRAPQMTTTSERMCEDIEEIARSLGYNCNSVKSRAGYKKDGEYIRCNDVYRITIYAGDEIYTLPRKKKLINSNSDESRKRKTCIVDIQYVGRCKCKCVTVDADDSSYLVGDFVQTHNCAKSYSLASIMSHNLILGENMAAKSRVTTVLTAYTKEYLSEKDGTLTKFTPMVDFCAANTEFPRLMLKRDQGNMVWRMGYKNPNGNQMGSLNAVMGLSVKSDEGKIRGKRGVILFEEMGNYPNFKQVWDNTRDSVKEGSHVFSQLYGVGTAGDEASDFSGVRTILYNPTAYEVYALDNVYDKVGKGAKKFAYFFPSYISRAGCMDKDGNSDVSKALMEILMERYMVKQGGDPASLLSRVAQMPITPEEAILKVQSKKFPSVMINERLRQLDSDPRAFDDVYVGTLISSADGQVEFRATDDVPIREWPVDNTAQGALEIYEMPVPNPPSLRYIIGHDPVDNDQAESNSLSSTFVFDLFTDRIVAEYTGRKPFADDNFEMMRLLCIFYNATAMVEANKKGYYSYFAKMRSTWMLADCPEYLRDRQLVKYSMFGSSVKGISVNAPINNFATDLLRDWMMKTQPKMVKDENGEEHVEQVPNLYGIRSRALLQECIGYGPTANTDRISAMAQVMLYREQFMVLYGGSPAQNDMSSDDASDDEFFDRDWQKHLDKTGGHNFILPQ